MSAQEAFQAVRDEVASANAKAVEKRKAFRSVLWGKALVKGPPPPQSPAQALAVAQAHAVAQAQVQSQALIWPTA